MIYVDDLLLMYHSRNKNKFLELEAQFLALYEFRVMGDASHFISIRILRNRKDRKLWLIQDSYCNRTLEIAIRNADPKRVYILSKERIYHTNKKQETSKSKQMLVRVFNALWPRHTWLSRDSPRSSCRVEPDKFRLTI